MFVQTAMRIYFNHFSGDYYFTEFQIKDHQYVNQFKDFLAEISEDMFTYLVLNFKKEGFETFKRIADYNLTSLKVVNKNYLEYLVSKEKEKKRI